MSAYSAKNRASQLQMFALWIPLMLTAIFAALALSDAFSGAFIVIFFGSQLVYFVAYGIALAAFMRVQPPRPMWHFAASFLAVELLISTATVYEIVA